MPGAGILHLPAPTPAQPPGRFPAESNQKIFVPVPAHFYHTGELLAKNLPKAAKHDVRISRKLSKQCAHTLQIYEIVLKTNSFTVKQTAPNRPQARFLHRLPEKLTAARETQRNPEPALPCPDPQDLVAAATSVYDEIRGAAKSSHCCS